MPSKVKTHFKPERPRFYFQEWRKFRRMTQEALAGRMDVSTSSISQIESGKQGFTDTTLVAMAYALSCEPGDLLSVNPFMAGEVIDLTRLLRGATLDQQRQALAVVKTLLNTGTGGTRGFPLIDEDGDDLDMGTPKIGGDARPRTVRK